ncbi:MAG: SRPBCC family protein [Gemmatimonadaceae bacterium]
MLTCSTETDMWQRTQEMTFVGIAKQQVWDAWSDVNNWHLWDTDIEYARMSEPFRAGAKFELKPRGGPRVKIELLRVAKLEGYTDLTRFPLARMYGIHDMVETKDGLRLTITMRVEGPLSFVWRKLVAEKVAAENPAQLESLARYARHVRGKGESKLPA